MEHKRLAIRQQTAADVLRDLVARLEGAKEGSGVLDNAIGHYAWANRVPGIVDWAYPPAYTTSLDAALSLVPEGWGASINISPPEHNCAQTAELTRGDPPYFDNISIDATANTAIIALCIAALRARLAESEGA